jgi:ammonia channel protein AmtB
MHLTPRCQVVGIGVVFIYDCVVTLIILKIVDILIGLRVSKDVERDGLDLISAPAILKVAKLCIFRIPKSAEK